jgi:hypothetical protein
MRRLHRLTFLALLLAAAPVLAGCENFDPDNLDIFHLNEKKKLPGERRELFPGGVPGVTQGVPPEYVKGYQQPADTAATDETLPPAAKVNPGDEDAAAALKPDGKTAAVEPTEPTEPPKPKKPKRKPKAATAQRAPAQVTIQRAAPGQSPWPAANPPAQPAQSPWPAATQTNNASPWPAAPAPGTFSKQ